MLIRTLIIFLIVCTSCRSGIIPCPDVKGLRLKKSPVSKRFRFPDRHPRQEPDPVITVSSDAKTPQSGSKNRIRYVKYTIEHVDVEDLDCPKPGEKRTLPRAVKNNIRKNRKKVRYYSEQASSDSLQLVPLK